MANQVATASISASSSVAAAMTTHWGARAALSGLASVSASVTESTKITTIPSTGGFAGITVNPTPYVYAAVQTILAAMADASNPPQKARGLIVMGPLPYVVIYGVAGSALALRTGGTTTTLSQQTMIAAMGCAVMPSTALLWAAVANYLFNNPLLLHADGFSATKTITGNSISVIDVTP